MRAAMILLLLAGGACTETPADIPPCVLPSDGCPVPDAAATTGDAAASDGSIVDGPVAFAPDGGPAD